MFGSNRGVRGPKPPEKILQRVYLLKETYLTGKGEGVKVTVKSSRYLTVTPSSKTQHFHEGPERTVEECILQKSVFVGKY